MRVARFPSEIEEDYGYGFEDEKKPVVVDDEDAPSRLEVWRDRAVVVIKRVWARVRKFALFGAGVAAAFVAILIYQALNPPPHQLTTKEMKDVAVGVVASVTPMPAYSEAVFQIIQPSLVLIQAETTENGQLGTAIGSGVVINDAGDILTALHVVTASTSISLTFADGSESLAVISTTQQENDIAVLTALTPPAQIVPATLGNPNAQRVGDEAYAVGNPFGIYGSMSAGVISGFGRSIKPKGSDVTLHNLIQFDAAVNPGNSGGPLLNRYGEVIGIVTGLVNPTEDNFFVGLGFAVEITTAAPAAGAPPY